MSADIKSFHFERLAVKHLESSGNLYFIIVFHNDWALKSVK